MSSQKLSRGNKEKIRGLRRQRRRREDTVYQDPRERGRMGYR